MLITRVDVPGQQRFEFTDPLPGILNCHIGELSDGQTFLAAHVAVSMLEELATAFTDSKLQSNALSLTVFAVWTV